MTSTPLQSIALGKTEKEGLDCERSITEADNALLRSIPCTIVSTLGREWNFFFFARCLPRRTQIHSH